VVFGFLRPGSSRSHQPSEVTTSRRPGGIAWSVVLGGAGLLWLTRPTMHDANLPQDVRQIQACQANLSRIGRAFALYARDYDGKFPRGVDPEDRYNPALWNGEAGGGYFRPEVEKAPMLQDLMFPYLRAREVWRCPSDRGYAHSRLPGFEASLQNVFPSSYAKYGTSYYYFTIHGLAGMRARELKNPAIEILVFDGDLWHESDGRESLNVLFATGHVQNLPPARFVELQRLNDINP
jgi:hypothetical protein